MLPSGYVNTIDATPQVVAVSSMREKKRCRGRTMRCLRGLRNLDEAMPLENAGAT
jgi:hypothetical protein